MSEELHDKALRYEVIRNHPEVSAALACFADEEPIFQASTDDEEN